jgi:putative PIN family toxin of toxin-antitoxin system
VKSVTLDSNIYISGLRSGGPASRLLYMARMGQIRLDISDEILTETIGVLREKFGMPGDLLHHIRGQITRISNLVVPTERLDIIKEDPDDNVILECARAAGSDYIITEDKNLLRLKTFEGIPIVRPVDWLGMGVPSRNP